MLDHRKQAVSIRLAEGDLRNIKRLAKRLGARDSDVIRFTIKSMLSRISPLCDEAITGRNLVPVLVEYGDELIRYFELDAYRLEGIINERAGEEARVHRDDIALLAMSGLREQYLEMRLNGNGAGLDAGAPKYSLRMYLYDKYIYRSEEAKPSGSAKHNGEAKQNTAATTHEVDGRVGLPRPAA
ncbi:MAG: hypothetical protein ACLPSY_06315 [Steroidobacteraceae bacterium]